MKVAANTVVTMHYTLTDNQGATLDSSVGQEPLTYLQGHQNIVPGLEKEMEGRAVGDKFNVSIDPKDGYGDRNEQLMQDVPKSNFPEPENIQVGMQFQTDTEAGPLLLVVKQVGADAITVDGNHPLAGVTLNFDIEVTDVRAATEEEVSHRHVHGPGGHHHE